MASDELLCGCPNTHVFGLPRWPMAIAKRFFIPCGYHSATLRKVIAHENEIAATKERDAEEDNATMKSPARRDSLIPKRLAIVVNRNRLHGLSPPPQR